MPDSTIRMDRAAIGLSFLCVVHCLLTPIAIVMLPALGATFLEDERFHYALLFLVLPTSTLSLGLGCRKHGHLEILLIGLFGLLLLFLIVILGEELLGELGKFWERNKRVLIERTLIRNIDFVIMICFSTDNIRTHIEKFTHYK